MLQMLVFACTKYFTYAAESSLNMGDFSWRMKFIVNIINSLLDNLVLE